MNAEKKSTVRCPQCEQEVTNVLRHWEESTDCSQPELTPQQHDVTCGLLLSGATLISMDAYQNGWLQVKSDSTRFVKWVHSTFGRLGEIDWNFAADEVGTFTTHPLQGLRRYWEDWSASENQLVVPQSYSPSPETLRVIYARAGDVEYINETPRVALDMGQLRIDGDQVEQIFGEFAPMLVGDGDDQTLYLSDTPSFLDEIGTTPIPGSVEEWPGAAITPSCRDDSVTCPSCNCEVAHIEQHWRSFPSCDPPEFSRSQEELLTGVLFGGGRLAYDPCGYYVEVRSHNRHALDWLDDEFGMLSDGVMLRRGTDEYRWRTRSHPDLDKFLGWASRDEDGSLTMQIPPRLVPTPTILGVANALCGTLTTSGLCIDVTHTPPTEEFVTRFFEEYDPDYQNGQVLLRDSEAFFEDTASVVPIGEYCDGDDCECSRAVDPYQQAAASSEWDVVSEV